MKSSFLRTVKIKRITSESASTKSVFFVDEFCAQSKPGQFVMIWLPGFDEIPMSISSACPEGLVSITAANVGEATNLLHKKINGDIIGVRGPLGNSFQPVNGNVLLVGGGTGVAPLVFLAEKLIGLNTGITFLMGAKIKDELLFYSKIKNMLRDSKHKILVSTEDGSEGQKGLVTDLAEKAFKKKQFSMVYACGKEPMLSKIFSLAEKFETPFQASLERLMRCAIGLCGSCTIGKYRVCVDGPVFTSTKLREIKDEFGYFKRDLHGEKIRI